MHGYEGLNTYTFFGIKNDSRTRGHGLALVKCHSRLDLKKYLVLPEGSKMIGIDYKRNATNVNNIMFKNRIDQYFLKTRREKT